jgi:hypothetical protein
MPFCGDRFEFVRQISLAIQAAFYEVEGVRVLLALSSLLQA